MCSWNPEGDRLFLFITQGKGYLVRPPRLSHVDRRSERRELCVWRDAEHLRERGEKTTQWHRLRGRVGGGDGDVAAAAPPAALGRVVHQRDVAEGASVRAASERAAERGRRPRPRAEATGLRTRPAVAVQVGRTAGVLADEAAGEGEGLVDSVADAWLQGSGGFGRERAVLLRRPAVALLGVEWMTCLLCENPKGHPWWMFFNVNLPIVQFHYLE